MIFFDKLVFGYKLKRLRANYCTRDPFQCD